MDMDKDMGTGSGFVPEEDYGGTVWMVLLSVDIMYHNCKYVLSWLALFIGPATSSSLGDTACMSV
jgi:hypothetical protein